MGRGAPEWGSRATWDEARPPGRVHDARALRCGARLRVPGGAPDLGDPKGDLAPVLGAVGAWRGDRHSTDWGAEPPSLSLAPLYSPPVLEAELDSVGAQPCSGGAQPGAGALSQVQGHPATFAGAQPPPGRTRPAVDRPRCVRARTDATPGAAAPEPPAPRAPGRRGEVPGVRTAPSRPASPGTEARLCTSGLPKRETVLKTRLGIRPGGQSLARRDDCPFYLCSVCRRGTSSL